MANKMYFPLKYVPYKWQEEIIMLKYGAAYISHMQTYWHTVLFSFLFKLQTVF